jgi:hypothetical protein
MPTPVFPTAYEVTVKGLLFGQLVENVWHCLGSDPFSESDAVTIADIFSTGYAAIIADLSQDLSVNEVHVQNLAGTSSGEFTLAITPAMTGGQVQDSEPGNVTFCISLRSTLSGRRFRGRKYFSGIPVGSRTGNTIDSALADALVASVMDLRAALSTGGFPMSIFSPTGLTLVSVVSVTRADLYLDSQRRRLTGRGA